MPQKEPVEKSQRPLLFVSHRHSDAKLASVVKNWAETWSMGKVEVFQSSATGTASRIGANLNEQLMKHLKQAQSVALIYTAGDQNWSYCMWECGVALDPENPDTKIIVFQCGTDAPAPFQDKVRVNVRDKTSVHNFVSDFLTRSDFFPRFGEPVAPDLTPKSDQVARATDDLYTRLQEVLPPLEEKPIEEWPAVAYVRLELPSEYVEAIENAKPRERLTEALKVIPQNCIVREADYVAARIFGMAGLSEGLPFQALLDAWEEGPGGSDEAWFKEVIKQLSSAACWRFPDVRWTLMKGADKKWYAPLIHWVRRVPSEAVMQFDLHFLPFVVDETGRGVEIDVPSN